MLTACRGLGIDTDTAREISSLVPITRGKVWTLDEIVNGREDNGFVPVKSFLSKVEAYPMLMETIREIEGLVCGRGSHASGLYIFNEHYTAHNSLMKSPKGIRTTCWDMGDSDQCSALKEDYLTIEALDKMYVCMQLLLEDHQIEWQGSLKSTYNKYFHPDVINYTDKEMWREAADGEVPDLFQMQTQVGGEAIRRIRPTSLKELSLTNAIMRLSPNEDMNPIDRLIAHKANINLWYQEMRDNGLNEHEISIMEKYLLANYSAAPEQEDVMLLVMDQEISGFTMTEANKLRKAIAKKKKKLIEECKALYYKKGQELGTRKELLDYVFKYCIKPQLGYSFSANHDIPYSCIAVQEMNMYHFYPHVYWQCAVLTVNAAANEEVDDSKSTNYGKVASAVSSMQSQGAKIALPDINQARFGFTPNAQKGEITFGLKAISGCGDDDAAQIIRNRPYASLTDFVEKNSNFTKGTMISLIKAGCFDALEGTGRTAIMQHYLILAAQKENPPKDKLNMQNIKSILSLGLLDSSFDFEKRLIGFRAYVFSAPFMVDKDTYRCDPVAQTYFENSLVSYFTSGTDYFYQGDQLFLYKKPFEKFYKQSIKRVADYISTPEFVRRYNETAVLSAAADLWDKNCKGTIPQWEMQSLSFYYTRHYLSTINANAYGITSFSSIPQDPVVVGTSTRTFKDKATGESKVVSYDKYQLYRIAGTVLDKNKNKHIITLLTTDGVVSVKFYAEAFAFYDRRITTMEGDKKKVVEESWFSRGSNLLVYGMRRGDMFYPKKYQDSIYQHTVSLITDVFDNGQMNVQNERAQV